MMKELVVVTCMGFLSACSVHTYEPVHRPYYARPPVIYSPPPVVYVPPPRTYYVPPRTYYAPTYPRHYYGRRW